MKLKAMIKHSTIFDDYTIVITNIDHYGNDTLYVAEINEVDRYEIEYCELSKTFHIRYYMYDTVIGSSLFVNCYDTEEI